MFVMFIGICNSEHKHKAMKVNYTFLYSNETKVEAITHDNIEECYYHHRDNEPGNAATKPFVKRVYE